MQGKFEKKADCYVSFSLILEAKEACPMSRETFDMDFAKDSLYWKGEIKKWFKKYFGDEEWLKKYLGQVGR